MAYEVYIDIVHHPKHADGSERKVADAFKFADLPEGTDELVYVVAALRGTAEAIDPRVVCTKCGETRGEHYREGRPTGLYRCHGRYGPITQSAWWGPPVLASGWEEE